MKKVIRVTTGEYTPGAQVCRIATAGPVDDAPSHVENTHHLNPFFGGMFP
jgi:hypothetical protein